MAIVTITEDNRKLTDPKEISRYLFSINIDYERWKPAVDVATDAPAEQILAAYEPEIKRLQEVGGYVTADVIDVTPETAGLDEMLAKFSAEHWHDDDEIRYIIEGRGIFHIHPPDAPVTSIEVGPGDMIRVPGGTLHWFNLCEDRRIRAIRLFSDPAGWVPRYTDSGVEKDYEPLCFGPAYIPPVTAR
jgi:1,2-dihydroxy-3-keto-5-methylthiopentene dioxygenase